MTRPGMTMSPSPSIAKSLGREELERGERILMGASIPLATVTITGVANT